MFRDCVDDDGHRHASAPCAAKRDAKSDGRMFRARLESRTRRPPAGQKGSVAEIETRALFVARKDDRLLQLWAKRVMHSQAFATSERKTARRRGRRMRITKEEEPRKRARYQTKPSSSSSSSRRASRLVCDFSRQTSSPCRTGVHAKSLGGRSCWFGYNLAQPVTKSRQAWPTCAKKKKVGPTVGRRGRRSMMEHAALATETRRVTLIHPTRVQSSYATHKHLAVQFRAQTGWFSRRRAASSFLLFVPVCPITNSHQATCVLAAMGQGAPQTSQGTRAQHTRFECSHK